MESKTIVSLGIVAVLIAAAVCGAVFVFSGDDDAEYTVKYNTNGAPAIEEKKFSKDTDTFKLAVPARGDGYEFLGWYGNSFLSLAPQ